MTPRRSLTAALAVAVLGGLLSAVPQSATADPHQDPERRVIVTLSGAAAATGKGALRAGDARAVGTDRAAVAGRQKSFLDRAKAAGVRTGSPRTLNLLLNAVAVTVKASEVTALKRLPGVVSVVPDTRMRLLTDASVPLINAPQVWRRKDPAGKGADGHGVTVAVLDSGVDYTHPDLGGGFGEGHKVVAGYDFANGDTDPMDDNGHGTHVAGIIAGRAAQKGGVTGVAPGASILAYKVMDDAGEGYTSDIVAGIEAAVDPANPHRADVINMSLGGYGDGTDPLGAAATAATRAGVVVVASAGNDGPRRGTVSTPAAGDGVIAVGASVSGLRIPSAAYRGGEKIQAYRGLVSANPPAKPVTAALVDAGRGTAEDWERAGDVEGKAVRVDMLVAQSSQDLYMTEIEMAREAERRGAIALIGGPSGGGGPVLAAPGPQSRAQPGLPDRPQAPSGDGTVPLAARTSLKDSGDSLRMDTIVMLGMDSTQYAELGRRLAQGRVEVTVSGTDATDAIASFSSRGPDLRWGLKPDLVAPGFDIRSTVPASLYAPGYYRMSGTSMAAPHVAGSAALLRQLHPGETPAKVTSELVGSTRQLKDGGTSTVGSGRLDVAAAAATADTGITTTPATLSYALADLARHTVGAAKKLTVTNSGTRTRTVRLKASGPARISLDTLRIPAGASATATVTLRAARPDGEAEITGTVTVTPEHGAALRVPYLLVVRKMFLQTGPDPSDGTSTAVVLSPAPLAKPPVLTVTPPHGRPYTVTTTLRTENVYQAEITGRGEGAHLVSAEGVTADGKTLTGNRDGFEVTPTSSRTSRWQPVGPNSESGDVTTAPSAPGAAVLTQYNKAGPWSTEDNGATWKQHTRLPLGDASGPAFTVIDPHDPQRWWYAANSASGIPRTGSILRTQDGGRTWQTLDTPDGRVIDLLTDETGSMLLAVTATDLLISRDGGDTWATEPHGIPADRVYDVAIGGDSVYFSTGKSLWKRDGLASGTLGRATKVYEPTGNRVSVDVVADSRVVAMYEVGSGVVGSFDGGRTWATLDTGAYGGTGLTLSGGDLYVGYGEDIRVGHDHGRRWSTIPAANPASTTSDFTRWADGSLTVSADAAGVYRGTPDGEDYRRIGVQGGTVNSLALSGDRLLAAGPQGTHRSRLPVSGAEWGTTGGEGRLGVATRLLQASAKDSRTVWRVRSGAWGDFHLERSGDAGATWQQKGESNGTVLALAVHPADPDRVYVSYANLLGKGLFSTEDGGSTWKNLLHDQTYFTAVAGDPKNPDRLWLGTPDGLYRSDNAGDDITRIADGRVDTIEFAGAKMLTGGDAIRVSTDGGRTFRTADTGKLPLRVNDIQEVGGTLYAASTSYWDSALPRGGRGVLRSTDGGHSWQNVSTGLQNLNATSLAASGGWLYVGTVQGGVHRLKL
ncbi:MULTISPECIES: S8 family serine peptidase [unclassified Streptomyces]|uniref:S8 family serine peptidase n=1 Tax=unclassified Streptomyces TaxID=2593676 RepID=UPI0033FEC1C1